jgi:hypothetical protein
MKRMLWVIIQTVGTVNFITIFSLHLATFLLLYESYKEKENKPVNDSSWIFIS